LREWLWREGRVMSIAGLLTGIYVAGKILGPDPLIVMPGDRPTFTVQKFLDSVAANVRDLFLLGDWGRAGALGRRMPACGGLDLVEKEPVRCLLRALCHFERVADRFHRTIGISFIHSSRRLGHARLGSRVGGGGSHRFYLEGSHHAEVGGGATGRNLRVVE